MLRLLPRSAIRAQVGQTWKPTSVSDSSLSLTTAGIGPAALARSVLALLVVVALAPALLVPIPAMVDYPNHLARMYLVAADGMAAANPYYRVEWALYPNLAMDLLVPQGARLIGVENATRLFLWLAQILVVSGAVALEFAVKRRVHLAPFAALMFLYCLPFTWGFLNFQFGFGVALWGIAAMLAIRGQS